VEASVAESRGKAEAELAEADPAVRALAAVRPSSASLSAGAIFRETSEVGAVCGKAARTDLSGGCLVRASLPGPRWIGSLGVRMPSRATETYQYDLVGNLIQHTDRSGKPQRPIPMMLCVALRCWVLEYCPARPSRHYRYTFDSGRKANAGW